MKKWLMILIMSVALVFTGCSDFFDPNGELEPTEPIPTVHKELIENIGDSTTVNGAEVGFVNMEYDERNHDLVLYFHYVNVSDDVVDLGMREVTAYVNGSSTISSFYGCNIDVGEEADGKILIPMEALNGNMTIDLYYYHMDNPFLTISLNMAVSSPTPVPEESVDESSMESDIEIESETASE